MHQWRPEEETQGLEKDKIKYSNGEDKISKQYDNGSIKNSTINKQILKAPANYRR
jgi:hypothetical protein